MCFWRTGLGLAATLIATGMFGGTMTSGSGAFAMGTAPPEASTVDCRKRTNRDKLECFCTRPENKGKPRCASRQSGQLSDDQIYQVAYWLAQNGKFEQALAELHKAQNKDDPRILNYIGYATRKLGRVREALGYYRKALAVRPDYTLARAYLGEAFLQQGRSGLAREQLAEIEQRCGRSCPEYVELSRQIASFEATGKFVPQGKRDSTLEQPS